MDTTEKLKTLPVPGSDSISVRDNEECRQNIYADHLPDVAMRRIFDMLNARDIWAAGQTCRRWRHFSTYARYSVRQLRACEFYPDLIDVGEDEDYEPHTHRAVFHKRYDLKGLVLVNYDKVLRLLKWLHSLFPNVDILSFRNYLPHRPSRYRYRSPPSRFHIYVFTDVMRLVTRLWPDVKIFDVSGEIVDTRALRYVRRWHQFEELRLSGADLSYNMLKTRHVVVESLTKLLWHYSIAGLRLSNLDYSFDMSCKNLVIFKGINNDSLTSFWLNEFFKEAIHLKVLGIDCRFLHDNHLVLMSENQKQLRDLSLRNCIWANDFSPIGKLSQMHSLLIDFNDKSDDDQMIKIVTGSVRWRSLIFNELSVHVTDRFMFALAEHCNQKSVPLIHLELNTEKTLFPFADHNWVLPEVSRAGFKKVAGACPYLEVYGVCSNWIDDKGLKSVAKRCPRLHHVSINDSYVTDEGVVAFCNKLRRHRVRRYDGCQSGYLRINVRNTHCTEALAVQFKENYGTEYRIII